MCSILSGFPPEEMFPDIAVVVVGIGVGIVVKIVVGLIIACLEKGILPFAMEDAHVVVVCPACTHNFTAYVAKSPGRHYYVAVWQ